MNIIQLFISIDWMTFMQFPIICNFDHLSLKNVPLEMGNWVEIQTIWHP